MVLKGKYSRRKRIHCLWKHCTQFPELVGCHLFYMCWTQSNSQNVLFRGKQAMDIVTKFLIICHLVNYSPLYSYGISVTGEQHRWTSNWAPPAPPTYAARTVRCSTLVTQRHYSSRHSLLKVARQTRAKHVLPGFYPRISQSQNRCRLLRASVQGNCI
jgi:hypothetical protein